MHACCAQVTESDLHNEGAAPIVGEEKPAGSDLFVMEQSVSPERLGTQVVVAQQIAAPDPQPEPGPTIAEDSEGQSQLTSIPKTAPLVWADAEEYAGPRPPTNPPKAPTLSERSLTHPLAKPQQVGTAQQPWKRTYLSCIDKVIRKAGSLRLNESNFCLAEMVLPFS